MYMVPFRAFDVPIGATIEYAGMAKWLYRSPDSNEVRTFLTLNPTAMHATQAA